MVCQAAKNFPHQIKCRKTRFRLRSQALQQRWMREGLVIQIQRWLKASGTVMRRLWVDAGRNMLRFPDFIQTQAQCEPDTFFAPMGIFQTMKKRRWNTSYICSPPVTEKKP